MWEIHNKDRTYDCDSVTLNTHMYLVFFFVLFLAYAMKNHAVRSQACKTIKIYVFNQTIKKHVNIPMSGMIIFRSNNLNKTLLVNCLSSLHVSLDDFYHVPP